MSRELTAKEHGDMLENDPKYQAMMVEKRRVWAEQAALLQRDEAPLVAALTAAGWPNSVRQTGETKSVWDFVNTVEPYPHLLGTLVEHLAKPYHYKTREGIARALAVREARGIRVPQVLMDELKKHAVPQDNFEWNYRWALINTLVLIGDPSMADDVRKLLEDSRYMDVRKDLQRLAKAINRTDRRAPKR